MNTTISDMHIVNMNIKNHQYRLNAHPEGIPKESDWQYCEEPITELKSGEVLIQVLYISLDPAMRGWMNRGKSYIEPIQIGEVMRALGIGRVIASKNPAFEINDYVSGLFGIQQYMISNGKGVTKVDANLAPLPLYLSVFGMPGMTAYFGLLEVGRPKAGDMVVVSAASGAVGALVGQIAKLKGCTVVGIAGGKRKCSYIVNELGFDQAIDYKAENVKELLKKSCPNGIDIYFDNVGGQILDDALSLLAMGARVVICGAISQYNNTHAIKGPSNYLSLLVNRASMAGFIVFDYVKQYPKAIKEMAEWVQSGQIKSKEDIEEGLEKFPETFLKLFTGENFGKLILKIAE